MNGGRFRIEVFPGGQIMPPFACFVTYTRARCFWTFVPPGDLMYLVSETGR